MSDVGRSSNAGRDASRSEIGLGAGTRLTADVWPDASDLERTAVVAHLRGRDEESDRAWEGAHEEYARTGDCERAARCAFWFGMVLFLRGEPARAGGWLARAERLAQETDAECASRGLTRLPEVLQALGSGDHARAGVLAEEIIEFGRRLGDRDLFAMGLLSLGRAELGRGEVRRGMQLFDEVMLSVTTREVSPIPAGIVYCAVLAECMAVLDLSRAAEWTSAFQKWCAAEPELVPYRGQCLVHRSQVLQAHGAWSEAAAEADRARQRLSDPDHPALGLALYQQGELHRLRGEFVEAERAYRAASEHGMEPTPGLALLWLAEGKVDAAVASVRRMVEESRGRIDRPTTLGAAVDVLLAAGDVNEARRTADELESAARAVDIPFVHALADYATGSVLLGGGDASRALVLLRRACSAWRELSMPYEQARARVAIALACRSLGDADSAELELDVARATFEALGAHPDLVRIAHLAGPAEGRASAILTDREREVLRLVASGKTNREIAAALVISEHTVARHLQNMFLKLGLSSRSAATAYAYEHGVT